jgi:hypothetical protein
MNDRRIAGSIAAIAILFSMYSCWPRQSLLAHEEESRSSKVRLRVFPEKIAITADYPGTITVMGQSDDGAYLDLNHSPDVQRTIDDSSIAELSEDGIIVAKHPGTTHLVVRYDAESIRIPIRVETDTPLTFGREVSATLGRSGCNLGTCHGNLHGKGGFRLSLRGDDPLFDFQRMAREYGGRRVDTFFPDQSLILRKATSSIGHKGGERFAPTSAEYDRIRRWIADDAKWTQGPKLLKLESIPAYIRLEPGKRTTQLIVQATFDDGTVRDVTPWARIEPSVPAGVHVGSRGQLSSDLAADVSFSVSYLDGRAASRVVFLGTKRKVDLELSKNEISSASLSVNPIDRLVEKQLAELRLDPTPMADDSTFIRRLYLVSISRLPTPDEVRAFLADKGADKIPRIVDRLLSDPGFDYTWAMRWSDLLRNEDKVMSPRGVGILHEWLRQQSARDRSVRDWVAELVSSIGSTYDNPPASFHRTHRDPFTAAESAGQVFLGVRMQCARCHNHPFDVWRQDDYYGLAAYFSTIHREQIDNNPRDKLDKHIITGDEIISLTNKKPEVKHPGLDRMVGPRPLAASFTSVDPTRDAEDSEKPSSEDRSKEESDTSVLDRFANWLTDNNRMFETNMANRVWSQYFGRGIVDPPDDFRDSNPPSNPELLALITASFRDSNYSVKTLSRLILTSQAFARSSAEERDDSNTLPIGPYFAGYSIRRMSAELLMDAMIDFTGVPSEFRFERDEGNSFVATKAMMMPGIPNRNSFLATFGKPTRLLDCECERSNQVSLGQSLMMVNGVEMREKLIAKGGRLDALMNAGLDEEKILSELFLASLSRFPTATESTVLKEIMHKSNDRRQTLEDILWSLLNSKEFVMLR